MLRNALRDAVRPALRDVVGGLGGASDPILALFAGGEQGAYYDPSDSSTVFTDAAMTTPAVADDVVGAIMDKSGNGYHLTQSTAADKPRLRTDGTLWWLEFDGISDFLPSGAVSIAAGPRIICAGFEAAVGAGAETGGNFVMEISAGPSRLILGAPAGTAETTGYFDGAWNETGAAAVNVETKQVYTVMHRNPGGGFRANGALEFSDTPTESGIASPINLSRAGGSAGTNGSKGNLHAAVVLVSDISAGDLAVLESAIAAKTGVTLP